MSLNQLAAVKPASHKGSRFGGAQVWGSKNYEVGTRRVFHGALGQTPKSDPRAL